MSTTAFPVGGRAIIEAVVRKFPDLFVNVDEVQTELTQKVVEQLAFSYPAIKFGRKRRSRTTPISKDSAAIREDNNTTSVFDMFSSGVRINPNGTLEGILVNDGDMPRPGSHANLPDGEAEWVPVTPHDHLAGTQPQEPEEPEEPQEPEEPDVDELRAEVGALRAEVDDLRALLITEQARVTHLETWLKRVDDLAGAPLKVIGKTESAGWHQHTVNLNVSRLKQGEG